MNPMQNLHIQDDDDFVNASKSLNVDAEPREEDIDGANDNTEVAAIPVMIPTPEPESSDVREEAIEGANDEKEKKQESSEESELRNLGVNKAKLKSRGRKKYADDSNDSENEEDRRRRKERKGGRRGDDTDGSKYGRRSEDEDEYRRNRDKYKKSVRNRNGEVDEVLEKEKKKREKYRESGSRRKDYGYDDDRRPREHGERQRRPRNYRDDESFSGRRSQNTSDREYGTRRRSNEQERSGYNHQQYPSYDPYSTYYQQRQYLMNLWQTNQPAYYEVCARYFPGMVQPQMMGQQMMPAMDDIGGSLRSGYSSSNEKERIGVGQFLPGQLVSNPLGSMNSSFLDTNDYASLQGGFPAAIKDLSQSYSSLNYGAYDQGGLRQKSSTAAARLTPKKFSSLHGFVRLTNGLMTTIDGTIKIENVPVNDKARRMYQSFPGPLVRGVSHKKTVIEFCEEKLKGGNASQSLLWSFLILMLRQNGNYTEGDVSELLMKNADDFKASLVKPAASDEDESGCESEENATESQETSTETSGVVLHKFRDFLLYGNINDALDFATENNLWGHALFLASKVDRRQHANVMLKFANKLPYNDPLQTLYQIMSGRMPACVTCLDDKWGDWRPHLAMIISNCTDKPELVKRSISALGDSLAARGDVHGSQFCYLLVEPEFGDDGKIVLLGAVGENIHKNDDAIIMTEVYEYARSLSDENFFVAPLQSYKFLLAANILDYGFQLKCLLYLEQIAKCITRQPQAFEVPFITKIYEFADRLKFYDPVMEKAYEDNFNNNELEATEDPKWLQELAGLMNAGYNFSYPVPVYEQQTPQHSEIYDPMSQQQTPVHVNYAEEAVNQYEPQQQPELYAQQPPQNYQPEQNYSYEYTNAAENNQTSQFQEQPVYDPTVNYQQPQQQQDYGGYGGWDQSGYQSQQPQPTITMANTSSSKFDDSQPQKPAGDEDQKKSPVKKPQGNEKQKAPQGQQAGSGWFGGIFNKLSMKPKNQMILPDDKNPAIVWDEATKKWVNKDSEDGAEAESFKPPPKMGDMMGNHAMPPQQPQVPVPVPQQVPGPSMPQFSQPQVVQQQQVVENVIQQQPMMPAGDAMPPQPAAPNMFKMQKGKNLKKSYVDIFASSGQTVQSKELTPAMDQQFFSPVQQQPQNLQFYNPNDFQ